MSNQQLSTKAGQLQIEYSYDMAIAPISNRKLTELADDLDFGDYEFNRTHWAIKDADLFHVLMRNATVSPTPRLFNLSNGPVKQNLVSVMMPFDARFDDVFSELDEMARDLGKRCMRADDIWDNDAIIQDIVSLISTSSVVICDLSGKNANVFYETGIAHTLGRYVILIAQSPDDVPFDLRHLRYVHYLNNREGREKLAQQVRSRIQTLQELR